ncbi:MAG TPA: flavodoxin family protein [Candidatus Acidoferrum sp.]|nr:flavodoxin family protein [Candidatus Acidoferrum sp.]
MRILAITGTEVKGCTYRMKEIFLDSLREGNEIVEYVLPRDCPKFCSGCKVCFLKSEHSCPHAEFVMPIWEGMLSADLLVFASPTYALRTTGQMKALLDHLCSHWMAHRPDERMFHKKAVILTNAIGPLYRGPQRDIATSLLWLGVTDIKRVGTGLYEGVILDELSEKRRAVITGKLKKLARRYKRPYTARKGLKVRAIFAFTRKLHQDMARKEKVLSADNQHWLDRGWIKL